MMEKKPTILLANGLMDAGGTETLIMEMLREKTDRVNYIMLIHDMGETKKGAFDDEILALGVPMVHIPSVGTLGVKKYVSEFQKIVGQLGPIDIIHSHLNANGGIICMAAKRTGIPHRISHCHADICYKGSWIHRMKEEAELFILKLLIDRNATDFWACSDEAWHRLFFRKNKKVVIPNTISVKKYLSNTEKKKAAKKRQGLENKFVLGSVGRVAPIKNYELALQITATLNKDKETHFICFGRFDLNDAYCAKLENMAMQMQIQDKVHFVGNSDNICDEIHCIDVFLMPSATEGFGMAAIEAQAASLPTLLSTGVPRKVDVGLGVVSFLPPDNVSAWTQAIKQIETKELDHAVILARFDKVGYDSATAVRLIEDHYLDLMKTNYL